MKLSHIHIIIKNLFTLYIERDMGNMVLLLLV
jgi:hypothetical protein